MKTHSIASVSNNCSEYNEPNTCNDMSLSKLVSSQISDKYILTSSLRSYYTRRLELSSILAFEMLYWSVYYTIYIVKKVTLLSNYINFDKYTINFVDINEYVPCLCT